MSTVALNMIVLNGEKGLRRLLPKVRKYVDEIVIGIDDRTTDKTERICRRHGALMMRFHFDDDFSAPRQKVLGLTKSDWMLWLDDDDDVEDIEKLPELIAEAEKHNLDGIASPYYYDTDPTTGKWTQILTRERAIRDPKRWRWRDRIHEHLVLADGGQKRYLPTPSLGIIHRHPRDPEARGERNIRLLSLMLSDDLYAGRDYASRTCGYFGHEMLRKGNVGGALTWLERCVAVSGSPDERYVALISISECHRRMMAWDKSRESCLAAVAIASEWADAYFSLCQTACAQGRWQDAMRWADMGFSARPRDPIISTNPMSYSFDPYLFTSLALLRLSRLEEALQHIERGLQVVPDSKLLLGRRAFIHAALEMDLVRQATMSFISDMTPEDRYRLWCAAPKKVRVIEEARREMVPAPTGEFDITFYCHVDQHWSPATADRPMGGSETAVVEMSRALSELGLRVAVFANPAHDEGEHNGVWWWNVKRLFEGDWKTNVLVAWRLPEAAHQELPCKSLWLWMHDLHYFKRLDEYHASGFDLFLPVSEWHAKYVRRQYPFLNPLAIWPTRNGLPRRMVEALAEKEIVKVPTMAIWTSSPDRGLYQAVEWWPFVRKLIPEAELHCCYAWGWDLIERGNSGDPIRYAMVRQMKDRIMAAAHDAEHTGIHWHGALSKTDLYEKMAQANTWVYPTDFIETFCLGALESLAHGTIPVTSALGALPDTVGPLRDMCLPGWTQTPEYEMAFVRVVAGLMSQSERLADVRTKAMEYARTMTWEAEAERWARKLEEVTA